MTWVLSLLIGVLVILVITAATGYFVAQEFAYMAVDRSRLAARAEAGDSAARRALGVTRRTSFLLSGAQLGITITGLLVGYVAEPLVGRALGDALGGVGVPTAVGVGVGTVLALSFSTLVQMLLGELFPKNLAIARPEPVAVWLARSTTAYLKVMGWLIRVFDAASNTLLRLLRIEPVHDLEHSATARDLERIVADSRASGDLPADLSVLLDRILDFPQQDVEHAMVPRTRVDVVRDDEPLGRVRERMATGHSRYPVVDPYGNVVGMVHLSDLLASRFDPDAPVSRLQRPALVLPTTMRLPEALRALSTTRNEMACVVDEYGGFAGVLTVEDIAEELVGEINDEHDVPAPPPVAAAEDGSWLVAGDAHIDEIERAIGHDLPAGEYETIAGLTIEASGALPPEGASVTVELPVSPALLALDEAPSARALRIEILAVERHVPSRLRLSLLEEVAAAAPDRAAEDGEGFR